jgi:hypothetical protein
VSDLELSELELCGLELCGLEVLVGEEGWANKASTRWCQGVKRTVGVDRLPTRTAGQAGQRVRDFVANGNSLVVTGGVLGVHLINRSEREREGEREMEGGRKRERESEIASER